MHSRRVVSFDKVIGMLERRKTSAATSSRTEIDSDKNSPAEEQLINALSELNLFKTMLHTSNQSLAVSSRLSSFANCVQVHHMNRNTIVIHEGDATEQLYFVLRGTCKEFHRKSESDIEREIYWKATAVASNPGITMSSTYSNSSAFISSNATGAAAAVAKSTLFLEAAEFYAGGSDARELYSIGSPDNEKYFKNGVCLFKKTRELAPGSHFGGQHAHSSCAITTGSEPVALISISSKDYQQIFSSLQSQFNFVSGVLASAFPSLKTVVLNQLSYVFESILLPSHKTLFRVDSPATYMYILHTGEIEATPNPRLVPGDIFGHEDIWKGKHSYTATVAATSACVYRIHRDNLLRVPTIAAQLKAAMTTPRDTRRIEIKSNRSITSACKSSEATIRSRNLKSSNNIIIQSHLAVQNSPNSRPVSSRVMPRLLTASTVNSKLTTATIKIATTPVQQARQQISPPRNQLLKPVQKQQNFFSKVKHVNLSNDCDLELSFKKSFDSSHRGGTTAAAAAVAAPSATTITTYQSPQLKQQLTSGIGSSSTFTLLETAATPTLQSSPLIMTHRRAHPETIYSWINSEYANYSEMKEERQSGTRTTPEIPLPSSRSMLSARVSPSVEQMQRYQQKVKEYFVKSSVEFETAKSGLINTIYSPKKFIKNSAGFDTLRDNQIISINRNNRKYTLPSSGGNTVTVVGNSSATIKAALNETPEGESTPAIKQIHNSYNSTALQTSTPSMRIIIPSSPMTSAFNSPHKLIQQLHGNEARSIIMSQQKAQNNNPSNIFEQLIQPIKNNS